MSEGEGEGREIRPARREPEVLLPGPLSPEAMNQWMQLMDAIMNRLQERVPNLGALAAAPEGWQPTEEEEKILAGFMEDMDEEIERYAKDMIRVELRDKILSKGPDAVRLIREARRRGIKGRLKRKKGCIFVQFGEGTPDSPIEEFLLAQT